MPICEALIGAMQSEGLDDVQVVVGGVIPFQDIAGLKAMGISGVYPGGTSFADIVKGIRSIVAEAV